MLTNVHICDSQAERSRAIYLGFTKERKSVVIHNGIDAQEYSPVTDSEKVEFRKAVGVNDALLIVTIARLAVVKNLSFAFDIVKEYAQRYGKIYYILVGDVDDVSWDQLHREVNSRGLANIVRYMGEQRDIRQFYHAADIFLTTSLREGLPTTVLEAQACGVPVLATNVVGNNEAIIDGKTGYLLPLGHLDGFVEKMWILNKDPQLRYELGAAGRRNVLNKFTAQSMCDKYGKLIESMNS